MRRQDIVLSLLHLGGYSKVRNLALAVGGHPVTRFAMFHDVPDAAAARFDLNLRFLAQHTNVISLQDFLEGKVSQRQVNTVLTFDDGFRSWVSTVLPILKQLGLPATFFVSSGFVGLTPSEQADFASQRLRLPPATSRHVAGLSAQDVRALADAGFTIGGHTASHADLSAICDADTIVKELAQDKQALERIIGRPVEYFAYPFGACRNQTHDLRALVAAAGYKAATTTAPGFNDPSTDRYLLRREIMAADMPGLVFRARALGSTDGAQTLRRWFASRRRNAARTHA